MDLSGLDGSCEPLALSVYNGGDELNHREGQNKKL